MAPTDKSNSPINNNKDCPIATNPIKDKSRINDCKLYTVKKYWDETDATIMSITKTMPIKNVLFLIIVEVF
jgi:hypothetical protein